MAAMHPHDCGLPARSRPPPPCSLCLPSAVQDIKTRASEGKHLRVLERSIFSDRQVGSSVFGATFRAAVQCTA